MDQWSLFKTLLGTKKVQYQNNFEPKAFPPIFGCSKVSIRGTLALIINRGLARYLGSSIQYLDEVNMTYFMAILDMNGKKANFLLKYVVK